MTTINLKDFYYWYTQDQFIEVSDEVAEVFVSDARHEMAYQRPWLSGKELRAFHRRMNSSIRSSSSWGVGSCRIDAHIILGKSIKEIAEAEGVHEESVRQSIKRGLERMKKTF